MTSEKIEPECLTCSRNVGADFISVQNEENSVVSEVLSKHFWFTEFDIQEATICQTCWDLVNRFHQFYVSVEELYRIRLASQIVKSEPAVTESDSLGNCQPETSDSNPTYETHQVKILVKVEPALEIFDEIETNFDQPNNQSTNERESFPDEVQHSRKQHRTSTRAIRANKLNKAKDDYIRGHVKFICNHCGVESPSFSKHSSHALHMHGTKLAFFECCGKRFFQRDRLYHHVQVTNNPDTFRCEKCGKRFTHKNGLVRHAKIQCLAAKRRNFWEEQPEVTRSLQPKAAEESDCLDENKLETLAGECEQQNCSILVKEEPTFESIDKNEASDEEHSSDMEQVQRVRKRKRSIFRKTTEMIQLEDEYIRKHVKYVCQDCGVEYKWFIQFTRHCLEAHGNNAPFVECCGKKYIRRDRLYDHVRVLNDPDIFCCKLCGKRLGDNNAFMRHMKLVHASEEEREFKCDRCPRTFTFKSMLNNHLDGHLIREGVKPRYSCTMCSSTFGLYRLLQNHVRFIHSGPIPTCTVCRKKFHSKNSMHRHVRKMHPDWQQEQQNNRPSDEGDAQKKNYSCTDCPRIFLDRKKLKDHIAAVHKGTTPHKCPFCELSFAICSILNRHIRLKHPKEMVLAREGHFARQSLAGIRR